MENNAILKDLEDFTNTFPFFDEIKGSTFFITGATGLVGSTLVKCLYYANEKLDLNIKIIGLSRSKEKSENEFKGYPKIKWIIQDMEDNFSFIDKVDYIIHAASPTQSRYLAEKPVEVLTETINGANNIFRFGLSKEIKSIVYLSSIEMYGKNLDKSKLIEEDETFPLNPLSSRNSYPISKRAIECLAFGYFNEFGLPIKIVRLAQVIGPEAGQSDHRITMELARAVTDNKDIVLRTNGESMHSYLYTIDAANSILFALLKGKNGEAYNSANIATYSSIKDLCYFVIKNFNPKIKLRFDIDKDAPYPPNTFINIDSNKLIDMGWKPKYNLREIYQRVIHSLIAKRI